MQRSRGNEDILTRHVTCRPPSFGVLRRRSETCERHDKAIIWYPFKPRSELAKLSRARANTSGNFRRNYFARGNLRLLAQYIVLFQ